MIKGDFQTSPNVNIPYIAAQEFKQFTCGETRIDGFYAPPDMEEAVWVAVLGNGETRLYLASKADGSWISEVEIICPTEDVYIAVIVADAKCNQLLEMSVNVNSNKIIDIDRAFNECDMIQFGRVAVQGGPGVDH